jgi:hypothetical protein
MRRTSVPTAILLTIFSMTPGAKAEVLTGLVYVSDYGSSLLDRYQYSYNETTGAIAFTPDGIGNNTTNATFLGSAGDPVKEGVIGTRNDLIVVGGSHSSSTTVISRYALDGTLIGTIPVNFSAYNSGNVGIGNIAVTNDGRYLYAPLSSANAIVKIDLTDGDIVASYSFPQAHDVLIDPTTGDIYAANYSDGSASIILLDSNLNLLQNVVTSASSGFSSFRPSGLSFGPDGSLYVENNLKDGPDSVLHYTISGMPGSETATLDTAGSYIGSSTNNQLEFTFGNNIGPDGNLYIAALGGGATSDTFNSPSGYVNGVYQFNTATGDVSEVIDGYTNKSGPDGLGGLVAPKYLEFDVDFIPADDAGYTAAPEPATWLLTAAALAAPFLINRRTSATKFLR